MLIRNHELTNLQKRNCYENGENFYGNYVYFSSGFIS